MAFIIKLIYLNTPNALDAISITKIRLTCRGLYRDAILEKLWERMVDWKRISSHNKLSPEFIDKHICSLDIKIISYCQNLTQLTKIKNSSIIDWLAISNREDLSAKFIIKYNHKFNWRQMSFNPSLSRRIIKKYAERIEWLIFSRYINENYIEQFGSYIDWETASTRVFTNKRIIEKYRDKIDWWYHKMRERRCCIYERIMPNMYNFMFREPIYHIDWDGDEISTIVQYITKNQLGNSLTNVFLGIKDNQPRLGLTFISCTKVIARSRPIHLRYFQGTLGIPKTHYFS